MRTLRFTFLLLMGITGILIFTGCAASPTPEPTPIPLPTETVEPTPTLTSEPTATVTIAPTVTVTLVPTPDLTGVEVLGAGPEGGFYLVNFSKPGIDKELTSFKPIRESLLNAISYKEAYPDRLICHGPMLCWGDEGSI